MTDVVLPVFLAAAVVIPWVFGTARAPDALKIAWGLAILATAAWMWWGDVHLRVPNAYGMPIALTCYMASLFCAFSKMKNALKGAA
ncbi:hypothetical protein BH10PSE3_BH10PSE3_26550 [soil metagenome]